MPRAISVVAPGNGSGKTRLIATVLRRFPQAFTAVKFTTVYRDGQNCPRTETACACRSLHGRYTIITDPAIITQDGTDTGRMCRAGASRTLWCLAAPSAHAAMFEHVSREILDPDERLIAEGNRIVPILRPEVLVMVVSPAVPRERWKSDTWDLMRAADLVVVNAFDDAGGAEEATVLADGLRGRMPAPVIVQDAAAPLQDWSDSTLETLARKVLAGGAAVAPAVENG